MDKQFVILYTHQKQKKAKTWHDGILKHSGTGTKAVLYDEKGCRLDSIHMKVEDIKLGEQLESDRYYILVEEVKAADNNIQKVDVISGQTGGAQITAQATLSRARCPGLKRKKTDFMPPRLVKQACLENSPSTQSDNEMYTGLPEAGACATSLFHSDSKTRVPLLPHQTHNISNINVQNVGMNFEIETLSQKRCMNNTGRNVYNLYSSYSKLRNVSGSDDSSQELTTSMENQKQLSPWSVYGSKNSSPSLGTSRFKAMGRSQKSDNNGNSSEIKGFNDVFDRYVDNKITAPNLTENTASDQINSSNDISCKSNEPQFCKDILHSTEEMVKQKEDCNVMKNQKTDESKRNISQIMSLLKKKPLPENSLQAKFTYSIKKDDLTFSMNTDEKQPENNNEVGETSKHVPLSSEKSSSTCIDNINARDQKDHLQNIQLNSNFNKESRTDTEFLQLSDEIFPGSDTTLHTNEAVSNDLRSSKNIQNKDVEELAPTAQEEGIDLQNNEENDEDELLGSFHINFSPLSHVTDTDDEIEVCNEEKYELNIDSDSGHYKKSVVCSVDSDDCGTNSNDINNLQHSDNITSCDDSKINDEINMKQSTDIVNIASRKIIKTQVCLECTQGDNCCGKTSENSIDVLHDIDQDFSKNSVLYNDEEVNNVLHEIKTDNKCSSSRFICDDRNTLFSNSFDTSGEESDFVLTSHNDVEKSISNDCNVNEYNDTNTLKPKILESGNLIDNVGEPTAMDKQPLDNKDVECNVEDVDNDEYCNVMSGSDTDVNAEAADENVVNTGSQYSRTTSNSLDTLDFSCDTLDSNSPNYHGIQTLHLGRLVPCSDLKSGLIADDAQKENKSCGLNQNGTSSPNISLGCLNHHKEAVLATNFTNASKCQNSKQFDWMKSLQSDKKNLSLDIVRSTAPSMHSGIEHLDSEDPLRNTRDIQVPPHPNKLIHRDVRGKADVGNTLKNKMYQEFNHPNHGSHLIDSMLGSHGTQGISSAVVSRVCLSHSVDRTSSSQYNEKFHTAGESPSIEEGFNIYRSPFQQLSDSDLSIQSSPAFYLDWQNNQPQICKQEKVDNAGCSPIDTSSQKRPERSSTLNSDEEEIYCKLYKPRMMYQHEFSNTSNTLKLNEESSPAIQPGKHKLSLLNKCTHEQLSDSMSSSLDCFPYVDLETFQGVKHSDKSPNDSTIVTGIFHSQLSDSSEGNFCHGHRKIQPSLRSTIEKSDFEMCEDSVKHIPDFSNALDSKWQNFVPSQTSDDCDIDINKLKNAVETTRKEKKDFVRLKSSPGLYNTQKAFFHSNVGVEKDENSVLKPLFSGLKSKLSGTDDDRSEREDENCSVEEIKVEVTKSEHITESLSHETQACLNHETQVGLNHETQIGLKHETQVGLNHETQVGLNHETQVGLNHETQVGLNHETQVGLNHETQVGVKYETQAKQNKTEDSAHPKAKMLNVVKNDKETQEELDSEMFSSMDSFGSEDFYMEDFQEIAKTKSSDSEVKEQEVPEVNPLNTDVDNVTSKKQQVCDSSNAYKKEKYDNESKVNAEVKGQQGSCLTRYNDGKREVNIVPSISVNFTNNKISDELDCEERELENEKKESNVIPNASEKVKHFETTDNEKKVFCKNVQSKNEEFFVKSSSSPCFPSTKSCYLVECNENKNASVTENITKERTSGNFSGFSLDESLDMSFSLDNVSPTEPDKEVSKTASMRIGWRPPVKSDSQKNPNWSSKQTERMLQQSSAKTSEKLRPTFKCLRLITQKKVSNETEQKTNIDKETLSTNTVLKGHFRDSNLSLKLVCDIKHKFGTVENDHVNERQSFDDMPNNTTCEQKRTQAVNLRNIMQNRSFKPPSMSRTPVLNRTISSPCPPVTGQQGLGVSQTELRFPARLEIERLQTVLRQVVIPDTFPTAAIYKQVLTSALTEYVNTQLLDVAKRYHQALSKVDTTGYSEYKAKNNSGVSNPNPQCQCGVPSKMICVKKEGPNCGRYFYACSANRNHQCKFFQWADEMRKGGGMSGIKRKIQDCQSLRMYMSDHRVYFYGECQLIKRTKENINRYFKAPKWTRNRGDGETVQKKQMFLKLPYKGRSSLYAKDDIWVISKHLDFEPGQSFLARSTYYGPSSSLEVEIEPLTQYSPSNWQHEVVCHAILAGNLSTELSCMDNIRDHIQSQTPPVIPYLLNRQTVDTESVRNSSRGFQAPRIVGDQANRSSKNLHIHSEQMDDLCRQYIDKYNLNRDQVEAMRRIANMFSVEKSAIVDSVLLIHGVFGAGKSFLLSVMVLFLVEVFHLNDSLKDGQPFPWKLLISSTTNVAVDRILIGLLDLGFEDFVRVGSVKKIAKPVLPFSVHASGTDSQELKDLQEMLRSGELTATEKSQVRQSIEKHRLGENKKKLGRVRIVGATCASCSLACLNNLEFPLVLLDECSQMTEPASLLPIARFGCQKLVLVGDPKQLDPTIQGVDAAHQNGLEQTMFDRLIKMGNVPTLLRTQYRCHPYISAVANKLFYGGMLEDGISQTQRKPLLEILPTVCYYDVERGVECCEAAGSYYNEREAQFVVFLLQVLLSSGIEPSAVGVITLYKSQMARISDLLTGQGDCTDLKGVQVSTVDAFQGGERDVIILSTVRTHACGFIDNDKRTNVALTRARHHLLIVGNLNNLSKNILWGKVINHCRDFENGIQSADEARHNLEKYLDNLKSSETSQNSRRSKSCSQDSSAKESNPRRKRPRRKRKLSDGHAENNSLIDEQSPCSSSNSPQIYNEELLIETTENCQPRKQQRKRQKHEDKLKTLVFDSGQENRQDYDDNDELPTFSCD